MLKNSFVDEFLKALNDSSNLKDYIIEPFFLRTEDSTAYYSFGESMNDLKRFNHSIIEIESYMEDSHVISKFKYNDEIYISKFKFRDDLIESMVYERYNESLNQMVLTVEYDGTNYYGMQKLDNQEYKTIQSELELALYRMLNEEVAITLSSRTDKGVHALGQRIQFNSKGIPGRNYIRALNKLLPKDIRIVGAIEKSQLFSVRFDVISKTYYYLIDQNEYSVFRNNYCLFDRINDLDRLDIELKSLIGTHDFRAFCKGEKDNTVRTIYDAKYSIEGGILKLEFTGSGFLHNMIRFIVGMLLYIDKTKRTSIKDLIESKDKSKTMKIASASGLYLEKIEY